MKIMKKLLSLILIVVMIFSMSTIAFAQQSFSMKIYNANDTHVYEAYQVFAGTVSNNKLVDITWGQGVKDADLLAELDDLDAYNDCKSAEDVAKVLESFGNNNNSAQLDAFAEIAGKHLNEVAATSAVGTKVKVDNKDVYEYTLSGLNGGYYLIKDKDSSQTGHDAYTKYILSVVKVVDNLEIFSKSDFPSIDKFIEITKADSDEKELVEFDDVSIGDTVSYLVKSAVPNMDGYDQYRFIVTDVMSKGLTFNGSVEVKIGETTLAENAYTLKQSGGNGTETTVVIQIDHLTQYTKGEAIEMRYSATVNEHAVIGNAGNLNTVKLQYSNNPNYKFTGINDNGPLGETPKSTTRVYTTAIEITKIDGNGQGALIGAEFEISGASGKKALVTEGYFEEVADGADGAYWKLIDGTYTTTDPASENINDEIYESKTVGDVKTFKKYNLNTKATIRDISPTEVKCSAFVDGEGKLQIEGLGAGTYTIKEVKAPAGYNLLNKEIKVEVGFVAPEKGKTDCQWTYNIDDNAATGDTSGILKFDVKNYSGVTLPSTGGMGTTLLYAAGSILLIGAGILIISKKRMAKKQ